MRTVDFRAMYAATVLSSLALFVPFVFLPSFAVSVGVDPVSAAALVGVIGVASVVGRLAIGALADRIGRIRTFRASFAILASSFVDLARRGVVPGPARLRGGARRRLRRLDRPPADGDRRAVRGARARRSRRPRLHLGRVGALFGPPLGGLLIDITGGYRWAIGVAGTCAVAAFLALLPLGRARRADAAL